MKSNKAEAPRSGSLSHIYFLGGYFTKEQYELVVKMMESPSLSGTYKANAPASIYPLSISANSHTEKWIVDS